VKAEGSLGYSGCEMMEFRTQRGGTEKDKNKITTLDCRRADFGLFKNMFGRVPQNETLEGRGVWENRIIIS